MYGFETAIKKLWSKAPAKTINALIQCHEAVFDKFGMNDPLLIAHFMSQISHECMAGTIVRENMNYSAQRITEIFGFNKAKNKWVHSAKVSDQEAFALAHNPQGLAERVYGLGNPKKAKELGNLRPGDGYLFRGNGMLQLTGGGSHKSMGEALGYNLYEDPQQLEDPAKSFEVACAEFVHLKCIPAAQADNCARVSRLVNGGTNGLAEREVWLRHWKECLFGVQAQAFAPRAAEVDETPSLLGTRTGQIGTVTGIAGVGSTVAQIGNYVSQANDTVTVVKDNATQVVETVKIVKPFLGVSHDTVLAIGIGFTAAVIVGVVAIMIYRFIKLRNEAV